MCESSGALLFNWPRDTSRRVISLRLDIVASARCSASAAARRTPHAAHSTSRPAPPPPAAVTPSDMRTKDRLAALKKASAAHGVQPDGDSALQLEPSQHQRDINDILEEVGRVRDWIRELTANTLVLRHLHADPTFHTNKLLQDRLDSVITSSNAIGLKICGALVQLEGRTREPSTATSNHVRARILRLQYAVTRRLYADALADHQRFLEVMHDHQLHLLQEQIKLTNLSISDDECQALLDTKNLSLFVDNVRADTLAARRALRAVEARHEQLARIEGSVRDVRDLFLRLSHLVADQQEQIDNVQHFALQATDYVESGEQNLMQGVVKLKQAREKKTQLIIFLVVGFLLILIILILT
ncbi:syntaxin-2-like isoform X2 [Galleria mellonella]|uniref:Syntaxin-2-like isoform X2 n=1 Tax=Galleria mellonella TaxID=7137 RepID=A0ABM3MUV2_GALME|nr:syntaxin-2-like isoform X2 [Galleria mellonella]